MASVFTRIWNILRGKTDVLLDKLEKPEEQVRVFVTELNEQVQDMQRSVASAIADEKRLQKQVESLRAKSPRRPPLGPPRRIRASGGRGCSFRTGGAVDRADVRRHRRRGVPWRR